MVSSAPCTRRRKERSLSTAAVPRSLPLHYLLRKDGAPKPTHPQTLKDVSKGSSLKKTNCLWACVLHTFLGPSEGCPFWGTDCTRPVEKLEAQPTFVRVVRVVIPASAKGTKRTNRTKRPKRPTANTYTLHSECLPPRGNVWHCNWQEQATATCRSPRS